MHSTSSYIAPLEYRARRLQKTERNDLANAGTLADRGTRNASATSGAIRRNWFEPALYNLNARLQHRDDAVNAVGGRGKRQKGGK